MKQPNHLVLSLACWALLPLVGQAQQDTLDMDVTFVGKRTMEVRDAVKLSSWPMARPLSTEKPTLNYDLLSKRIQFEPTMTPVEATRLRVDAPLSRLYRGHVRAGGGSRGTSLLDASYTDLRSREGSWGTSLHHASTASPSNLLSGRIHENMFDAWNSRFVGQEKISFSAHLGQHKTRMFGFDSVFVDSTSMDATALRWRQAGATLELKSHRKDSTSFNHVFNSTFDYLTNNQGLAERHLLGELNLHRHVWGKRLDIGIEAQLDRTQLDTSRAYNQAIVKLNPRLSTEKGPWRAAVGLGVAVDADQPTRDEIGDVVHVYPRAEVSVNLFRNLFVPYAKVGGNLMANNLHHVLELNPFFAPDQLDSPVVFNGQTIQASGFRSTNKRLAFSGGVRGTVTQQFRFHGHVSSAQHEDFLLFRPTAVNRDTASYVTFEAVYDTVNVRTLGGEVGLSLGERFDLKGSLTLNSYKLRNEDQAWHLPTLLWDAAVAYQVIEGLAVQADVQYVGERYALSQDPNYGNPEPLDNGNYQLALPGYFDVNLTANYRYNDRLGAWLTLANLANTKYSVWGGHPVQGFQVLGGVQYAF
ncbi:MAG: hypothetical protein ACPGYM_02795 [Flavobacteriales bacterium]